MYRLLQTQKTKKSTEIFHSDQFFHLTIVGRSGSGKTRLLVTLLQDEFSDKFHALFLICPTFHKNRAYDYLNLQNEKIYILSDPIEKLDESISLARSEAIKYHRSLIIFDDVIGNSFISSRIGKYVQLLIGGRHDGISTITLTQQLTSLSKPARDQMTRVISFYNPDADDRKILFDKFLVDVSKEERKHIVERLRSKNYQYIDINILRGRYTLSSQPPFFKSYTDLKKKIYPKEANRGGGFFLSSITIVFSLPLSLQVEDEIQIHLLEA